MTDHGHRVDGSTDTSPTSVGTDPRERPGSDDQAITNVLPFPGDWFGPIEELEPIDPDPPAAATVSAAAFWDEDAGAVHQLVEFPDGERPDLHEPATDPVHPLLSGQRFDANGSAATRRSRVRWISLAFLCLFALVAAGSALVLDGGLLHHRAPIYRLSKSQPKSPSNSQSQSRRRQTQSPAPQVTVTAAVATATVTTATVSTAPKRAPRHRSARSAAPGKAASSSGRRTPDGTHAEASLVHHRSSTPPSVTVGTLSSSGSVGSGGSVSSSGSVGSGRSVGPGRSVGSDRSVSSGGSDCVQSPDSGCLP